MSSFLSNASLKKKLLGGSLLSSFIIMIVGGIGIWSINNANDGINKVKNIDLSLLLKSEQLQIMALTHRRYEKDFFLTIGNPEKQQNYLTKFKEVSEKTNATLDQVVTEVNNNSDISADIKAAIQGCRDSYKQYSSGFLSLSHEILADPKLTPQGANKLMMPLKDHVYKFENGVEKLGAWTEKGIEGITTDLVVQGQRSKTVITLFLVGGVVVSILLNILLSMATIKPINAVAMRLKDIAQGEGDITKRLDVSSRDEVGQLALWFNTFLDKLQPLIKEIGAKSLVAGTVAAELAHYSNDLSVKAGDMSAKSGSVAASSEEMSTNIHSVSAAMEQSSSNVAMVASSTEEMTATVKEIGQSAEKARTISANAVVQSRLASDKIAELGESAKKVGNVTEVITEISEQTNLLALNATIEAARAGESGKGFAVVANEIKELARQTASATVDIRHQIDDMQNTMSASIGDIKKISDVIVDINNVINVIVTAAEKQSTATKEIAINISQAAEGILEVNGNMAQSSTVVQYINVDISKINQQSIAVGNTSNQVKQHANNLSELAGQLNAMISRFKA
jgi:methyl-accepting chemotaxis protein